MIMAAITSVAISAAVAGYSIYNGERQRKKAEDALNDFDRQELENVYEDIPISTYGSDRVLEQSALASASATQAARESGVMGVLGALPRIQAQSNTDAQTAAALVDKQITDRAYSIADDNRRIQGFQENRDNADLTGIGRQMDVGRQQTMQGIRGLGNAAISATNNIDWTNGGNVGNSGNGSGIAGRDINSNAGQSLYTWNTLDEVFSARNNGNIFNSPDFMSAIPSLTKAYEPKLYGYNGYTG